MKLMNFDTSLSKSFFLIAGPCVIESRDVAFETANELKIISEKLNINLIYKSSFDKANRSSNSSFRGLGMDKGLQILWDIRQKFDLPIITDVHDFSQIEAVSSVVDILQIPALLCRQTDLIKSCAATLKPINIKKGQFLSPNDMLNVVDKARVASLENGGSGDNIMICERGSVFGYNNLIVDMRSLVIMRESNCPIVFDATHSVQLPGKNGNCSSGQSEFAPYLAKAAIAIGVSGLFMETHPDPINAKSDGANSIKLSDMYDLLLSLIRIDNTVKNISNNN